ncbi:hypothetical protein FOA52_008966 [Chlamydomonas sp. UWO 241]|nr:hypothetical protein FOA52_008966 [Chlamydomonas sp. UWO 241]
MRVFDVRCSPTDPDLLASASDDTTARVWKVDQESGRVSQVACCFGHTSEVLRLAWSQDGRLLASGSADGTVRVWEPQRAGSPQVALLDDHPEEVYYCDFLRDGHLPATSSASSSGRGAGGGGRGGSPGDDDPCAGYHLLSASSESLFVWDVASGALLQKADAPGTAGSSLTPEQMMESGSPGAYIFGVARQPAGSKGGDGSGGGLVVTACSDAALRLWSLAYDEDGTPALTFLHAVKPGGDAPNKMLTACAFSGSGAQLAVTARDGTVYVLDVKTMAVARTLQVPYTTYSCAFVHVLGGAESLAITGAKGTVTLIDLASPGKVPITVSAGHDYREPLLVVAESPCRRYMVAAGDAQVMAPIPPPQPASPASSAPAAAPAAAPTAAPASASAPATPAHGPRATGAPAAPRAAGGSTPEGAAATAVPTTSGAGAGARGAAAAPAAASADPAKAAALAAAGGKSRRRARQRISAQIAAEGSHDHGALNALSANQGLGALEADPFGEGVGPGGDGGEAQGGGGRRAGAGPSAPAAVPADEGEVGSAMRAPIFIWRRTP